MKHLPKDLSQVFTGIISIIILCSSNRIIKYFQHFLNSCLIKMSFSMKTGKDEKLSFLDVEIIIKQGRFTTTIYPKLTFSGAYKSFTN